MFLIIEIFEEFVSLLINYWIGHPITTQVLSFSLILHPPISSPLFQVDKAPIMTEQVSKTSDRGRFQGENFSEPPLDRPGIESCSDESDQGLSYLGVTSPISTTSWGLSEPSSEVPPRVICLSFFFRPFV